MEPVSFERVGAKATYAAPWLTVGNHTRLDVAAGGDAILKPTVSGATATHVKIQALSQNIRYTLDDSQATATHGFQLVAGSEVTLPVPNRGISIFEEVIGAIVQFQWLR